MRIQAATRGWLTRVAVRPFAVQQLATPLSSIAYLRTAFGRRAEVFVFDRATRRGVSPETLLKRCGVKTKKASSARKARDRKVHTRAVSDDPDSPCSIIDTGNALYMVGGSHGMDVSLLRKRLSVRPANFHIDAKNELCLRVQLAQLARGSATSACKATPTHDSAPFAPATHMAVMLAHARAAAQRELDELESSDESEGESNFSNHGGQEAIAEEVSSDFSDDSPCVADADSHASGAP